MGESPRGKKNSPDIFPQIHVQTLVTKGIDNRPIALVKVKNQEIECLLDSGSNSSIAGPKGIDILKS